MSSSTAQLLKQKLAITPKTASLLIDAGYKDYREIASKSISVDPNTKSKPTLVWIEHLETREFELQTRIWPSQARHRMQSITTPASPALVVQKFASASLHCLLHRVPSNPAKRV